MEKHRELLCDFLKLDCFKLDRFMLTNGDITPIYIDIRHLPSHPKVFNDMTRAIHSKILDVDVQFDTICGVPYSALPIAAALCSQNGLPMVIKRKEAKTYGTKKMIEGFTETGITCLIIEDIVVSGTSILDTAVDLRKEGLIVTDCICVLDRLQGGQANLSKAGIKLHPLFNVNDIFSLYCSINEVNSKVIKQVEHYLQHNIYTLGGNTEVCATLPFAVRSELCTQPVLKRVFDIIAKKESNLCVAADLLNSVALLSLANELGPHICILKTHIDILTDFDDSVPLKLKALAKKHNFLILEDRKFADTDTTVIHQYRNGMYKIQQWADIVTVHGMPGSSVLNALQKGSEKEDRACILVADMSYKDALMDDYYKKKLLKLAQSHPQFVAGFISQQLIEKDQAFIHMFPDVPVTDIVDMPDQQCRSPEKAIADGADVIIVGKAISGSYNVVQTAIEYKTRSYNAYMKKCSNF